MCVYSFTVKASSVCKMSEAYMRGMDQRSCVVSINLDASAKFLDLRVEKCHISPPKTKLHHADKLERKRCDILATYGKMIYIDIGYKSVAS